MNSLRGAIEKYLRIELERFGTKALILCGENGYAAAGEQIKKAAGDFPCEFKIFHSTCCSLITRRKVSPKKSAALRHITMRSRKISK